MCLSGRKWLFRPYSYIPLAQKHLESASVADAAPRPPRPPRACGAGAAGRAAADKTGAGRGAARLLWCTLVVVQGVLGEGTR